MYSIVYIYILFLLAQTKCDFDRERMHRFVPVKALQRFHAVGFSTLSLITIPNNGGHHFLAMWMLITSFQRLVARTLEVQYRVVDRRRLGS